MNSSTRDLVSLIVNTTMSRGELTPLRPTAKLLQLQGRHPREEDQLAFYHDLRPLYLFDCHERHLARRGHPTAALGSWYLLPRRPQPLDWHHPLRSHL